MSSSKTKTSYSVVYFMNGGYVIILYSRCHIIGNSLTSSSPPHVCACPKLGPILISRPNIAVYFGGGGEGVKDLCCEVVVRFVDICGIVFYHHCLSSLFIAFYFKNQNILKIMK